MLFKDGKSKEKEERIEAILCEKYNSYYRMAYSYVHNDEDAADIVQEGAYKAIRYSDSLKDIQYAETWIYRIMLNEAFRLLGKNKEMVTDTGELPEQSTGDEYADADFESIIEELNPQDRAIVQMRFFEDMSLEDIAETLEENISTVKSRLYRSLKKLKIELAEVE